MAPRRPRRLAAVGAAAAAVVAALAAAAPPPVDAQAALRGVRLEPTRTGMYVEADVVGADAGLAVTARLRPLGGGGGGGWADLPPLAPPPGGGGVYATKAVALAAATAYEVEVRLGGSDGGDGGDGPAAARGAATTLPATPPRWAGTTVHVGGPTASARGDGSAASPFVDVAAGLRAAAPGDRVLLAPGVYAGPLRVPPSASGTAAAPLFLTARPGAVVTTAAAGLVWSPAPDSAGLWRTALPRGGTPPVSVAIDGDGSRLYPHASLASLADGGVRGVPDRGLWHDTAGGWVYVRLPSGRAPGAGVRVATAASAVRVEASHVVVSGLEVAVANEAGVEVVDASGVWVVGNRITSTGNGVVVRGRAPATADANVVADNTITERGVVRWPWAAIKGGPAERSGVRVAGTAARTLVRGNTIRGFFNGVYVGSFDDAGDRAVGRLTEVAANRIYDAADDGLEPEGACVGVTFLDNTLTGVRTGLSLAPITVGPVFVVRTVIAGYAVTAIKVNNGPTGRVYVYHTTAIPGGAILAPASGSPARALAPSRPFGGLVAKNNLFLSDGYCVEMSWGGALLGDGAAFDYNVWACRLAAGGSGNWFKWRNVRHAGLAELTAATGQEAHGVAAAGRPAFDAGWAPAAGSPAVDAGVRLPGINDGRVVGGVDVGAVERGL